LTDKENDPRIDVVEFQNFVKVELKLENILGIRAPVTVPKPDDQLMHGPNTVNDQNPNRQVFEWPFFGHFLGPVFEW
jgi:hypothetical protein